LIIAVFIISLLENSLPLSKETAFFCAVKDEAISVISIMAADE